MIEVLQLLNHRETPEKLYENYIFIKKMIYVRELGKLKEILYDMQLFL